MSNLFLISTSITLLVLSVLLLCMFAMLNKSLMALTKLLKELHVEFSPAIRDLRTLTLNVTEVSDNVRVGVQRFSRMSEAVGNIGDDLELGRRSVKGGIRLANSLISLLFSKIKG
jgi:uncharacterized protein YoxC